MSVVMPAIMAHVEEVEVVVAHSERVTLRVGDVFLEIDGDQRRTDVAVEAMAMAPIQMMRAWHQPRPHQERATLIACNHHDGHQSHRVTVLTVSTDQNSGRSVCSDNSLSALRPHRRSTRLCDLLRSQSDH